MYCRGNPIRYSDPSGYLSNEEWKAIREIGEGIFWTLGGIIITQLDSPLPGPGDVAGFGVICRGVAVTGKGIQLLGVARGSIGSAKLLKLRAPRKSGRNIRTERHHLLPKQFKEWFRRKGLDIEKFKIDLEVGKHKAIHGKGGGEAWRNSWNMKWKSWIRNNPGATREEILEHMIQMRKDFEI